jgi:hypothetical protein
MEKNLISNLNISGSNLCVCQGWNRITQKQFRDIRGEQNRDFEVRKLYPEASYFEGVVHKNESLG